MTMECLPDSIVLNICCYIHLEQIDLLRRINKRFNALICSKDFLLARRVNGVAEKILFFAGGKYPVRMTKKGKRASGKHYDSDSPSFRSSNMFRYTLDENPYGVIRGYIPSLGEWRIFGRARDNFIEGNVVEYFTVIVPHLDTLVYLGGRYAQSEFGTCSEEVWAYSFQTNRFEQWPPMRHRRCSTMFHAALVGNHIVVVGSDPELDERCAKTSQRSSFNLGKHCEKFDLQSRTWTAIADAPYPYHPEGNGGVASIDDRFLFIPGCHVACDAVEEIGMHLSSDDDSISSETFPSAFGPIYIAGLLYDLENDSWRILQTSNVVAGMHASTIAYNGRILTLGGFHRNKAVHFNGRVVDYGDHLEDVQAFDPDAMVWLNNHEIPPLPVAVRGASACIHNGKLTVLGGLSSFSLAFNSNHNDTTIWQLHDGTEESTWRGVEGINLPFPALLDGFAFSLLL